MRNEQQSFIEIRHPLKLMYITNRPDVAKIAEDNTVDRIWVDLETRGKAERQGHIDSVKSNHTMSDISKIRSAISKAQLLVRVNPLWSGTQAEVDEVIFRGADIVMLPMFHTVNDVKQFVDMVNNRAKVLLLVETIEAEENIDAIASVQGVDEIHIGLNDLHLAYGMKFMFELLANGQIEAIAKKISEHRIPYGFGGIASLDEGLLPARYVLAEHYRLGSSMAILSRSFCNITKETEMSEFANEFKKNMIDIRNYERFVIKQDASFYSNNRELVNQMVRQIVRV